MPDDTPRDGDAEQLASLRAAWDQKRKGKAVAITFHREDAELLFRELDSRDAALREARAEIERLKMPGSGHAQPCRDCGLPCSSIAGNPGQWPVYLGDGYRHVGCVRKALDERGEHRGGGT